MLDARPQEVLPMPKESAWPLIVAVGMAGFFVGVLIVAGWLIGVALIVIVGGVWGWMWPTRPQGLALQ
jgi:hypothetical protein